jgi:tetratricopeptide (TPR) repeat protein
MKPPMRHDLSPPFYELGEDIFENLCRDLFCEQQTIETCERYGTRGQAQHGIDLLAYCVDPKERQVGQCKCYKKFTPADIKKASKIFLDNEKKWKKWNVKRFILFVACEMSTTQHHEQIRKEKGRFKKRGIKYEAWSSPILRQKLRPYPAIVANYISESEYWVEKICGRKLSVYERPPSTTSDQEFLNLQIDQLSAALSSSKTKEIDNFRELVREGKAMEAFKQTRRLRKSIEWTVLDREIKADILVFESSLVLQLEDDLDKARELVKQSQQIYPEKDLSIIKTLFRYHEEGPEKALNEINEPKCIEEFNLRAALLLELHKSTDVISLLKGIPQKLSPNAETRRLLALSYLFRNNIPQAQYEIQKAIEERPNWLSIRFSSAIINYYSALSHAILPKGIQALPEPVEWYFINRDDESLKRLHKAEETFHKLIKDTNDVPKVRKKFQIWRLACLFNHPDRQTDADGFCRDLLADHKRHPLVVIWAITRNIHYDYSEYEVEFKKLIENNTIEIDQIIALLLIYLFSDKIKEAIDLLNQTKQYFSNTKDKFLWPFWKLQTLLRSGDIKTASSMIEDPDFVPFKKEILILVLKYLDPKSENWQYFMSAAEALFEEIGNGNFLFQICIAKARGNEWDYIALHEKTLIRSVMTSEALRLAAIALFNKGQFERCLNLLDDNRYFFTSNVLPQDLRRMRINCQIELGLLPQALREAEEVAMNDPSFENLMSLFEAQITHGDRWGMIGTARKLVLCQDANSSGLLRAARLVHLERHDLAVKLFFKALKGGFEDEIIPQAHYLGIYLGLHGKIGHLTEKMTEFAKSGKAGVQSIGLNDLVNWQKQRVKENDRILSFYEKGSAPVHFITERLGIPLSTCVFR